MNTYICTTVCVMILVLPLNQTRSFLLKKQIYIPSIVSWILKLGMFMQSDWRSQSNRSMMVTATPVIQKFIMIRRFILFFIPL